MIRYLKTKKNDSSCRINEGEEPTKDTKAPKQEDIPGATVKPSGKHTGDAGPITQEKATQ